MIVLVVGMHRSGTSLVSRSLKVFGVEHGDQLLSGEDNKKGHWEDIDILALNNQLLSYIGKTWYSMSCIQPEEIKSLIASDLYQKALELIKCKTSKHKLYGFKDPRTSVLLPFWQHVFEDLKIKPSIIHVFRRPIAVFESLANRNDFHPLRSQYLWISYNLCILEHLKTSQNSFAFINYEKFMTTPGEHIKLISNHFNLQIIPEEALQFEQQFVDSSLDHSGWQDDQKSDLLDASRYDLKIYNILVELANQFTSINSFNVNSTLEQCRNKLDVEHRLLRLDDSDFKLLYDAVNDYKSANESLEAMRQSSSWRITQPLRQLGDLLQSWQNANRTSSSPRGINKNGL